MSTIVVDASVIGDFLLQPPGRRGRIAARLGMSAAAMAAPHLLDAEVGQLLRHQALRGTIRTAEARTALTALFGLPIERYPHTVLLTRAFELRDNATVYDAIYVALAEALDAPLLTRDAALAKIPGTRAHVEVVSLQ